MLPCEETNGEAVTCGHTATGRPATSLNESLSCPGSWMYPLIKLISTVWWLRRLAPPSTVPARGACFQDAEAMENLDEPIAITAHAFDDLADSWVHAYHLLSEHVIALSSPYAAPHPSDKIRSQLPS